MGLKLLLYMYIKRSLILIHDMLLRGQYINEDIWELCVYRFHVCIDSMCVSIPSLWLLMIVTEE